MRMAKNIKSYFEHHALDYSNRHEEFYKDCIDRITDFVALNPKTRILDIGCGDGGFVKCLYKLNIQSEYIVTDLSFEMIQLAKKNLIDSDTKMFVADIFNLPLREDIEFDIIHIDSVLHHLIDKTRTESNKLVNETIKLLVKRLSSNGILVIDEWYFVSLMGPSFASFLIFYGLRLINSLKIDLSFIGEIRPGLEVNFMEPKKLLKLLSNYGRAQLLMKKNVNFPIIYKLFLLIEKGRITYVLRKNVK